jgi:hypothetical protein
MRTRLHHVTAVLEIVALLGCSSSDDSTATAAAGTEDPGDSSASGDGPSDDGPGNGPGPADGDTSADGGPSDASSGPDDPPPSEPGVHNTIADPPGDGPVACEWDWTVRTITYHPTAVVPRRMYHASCGVGPNARMFTSLSVGENAPHPEVDPTSGAIVVADLDDTSGTLVVADSRNFPDCEEMHGIAVSDDCQTIGALCRVPSGTPGFDKDVLATHPDADWMTNPYICGDNKMNDEIWLYEWTTGDIQAEPKRYIVHKSFGSWEDGNNYLRLGNDDSTWGIALKATVGGQDGPGSCHEADAFLVMDRASETMTTRGWSWACGTGHTLTNRVAYNPATGKYALMCSTDYNDAEIGGIGAYVFHLEDGPATEFHYLNLDGIDNKGGASTMLARPDGGYVGLLVGVPGEAVPQGYPETPGTSIGLVQWNADGSMDGEINWILQDPDGYLSNSSLTEIAPGRYLVGYGVMRRHGAEDPHGLAMRIPTESRFVEIDLDGNLLTEPLVVEDAGWGDYDEMVPLGQGRAGWTYIPNSLLGPDLNGPSCNAPELQLSVYTSPLGG